MSESLSREEIDALLSAITADEDVKPSEPANPGPRIKIYDFKRPERFSAESIRELSEIHERFARSAATALSRATRSPARVRVASLDQLTYMEFLRSIPIPTLLCSIEMEPLPGEAILEIDPAVSFALVELLFGGDGRGAKADRELTDIETALMEGIVLRLLAELRAAWAPRLELSPRLSSLDRNLASFRVDSADEMTALVTLETKVGEAEGMMNLCLPYPTLAPFLAARESGSPEGPEPLLGPEELGRIRVTRYAIFDAEGEGPTSRELSALLAAGEAPAFRAVGRSALGASSRQREERS